MPAFLELDSSQKDLWWSALVLERSIPLWSLTHVPALRVQRIVLSRVGVKSETVIGEMSFYKVIILLCNSFSELLKHQKIWVVSQRLTFHVRWLVLIAWWGNRFAEADWQTGGLVRWLSEEKCLPGKPGTLTSVLGIHGGWRELTVYSCACLPCVPSVFSRAGPNLVSASTRE